MSVLVTVWSPSEMYGDKLLLPRKRLFVGSLAHVPVVGDFLKFADDRRGIVKERSLSLVSRSWELTLKRGYGFRVWPEVDADGVEIPREVEDGLAQG